MKFGKTCVKPLVGRFEVQPPERKGGIPLSAG